MLLKLIRLIIFRSMRTERLMTLLSILGVGLGIGLFIGVKVASDRAVEAFESSVRGLNPYTEYEIDDTSGIDFDERVYAAVRRIAEKSFPLLRTNGYLPELRETIDINGVYTVKTIGYLRLDHGRRIDMEAFFRTPNAIIVTKRFADAHALRKGDELRAQVYDRTQRLRVVEVLDRASLPPNTVLMDLGNFQELFGRVGRLSRIDVSADAVAADHIRESLPSGLTITPKAKVIENQKELIRSFRYNLQFVSLIAILVGVFLLYNAIFITVVKKRTEIGILRGLGAGRRTIVLVFLSQGLFLGTAGSLLGIGLGQLFAYASVAAVEKTITTMFSALTITDYLISASEAAAAIGIGIGISLAASAVPAYEASRVSPSVSAKEGSLESGHRRRRPLSSALGVGAVAAGCAMAYLDYRLMPFPFPFLSYGGILCIILGFALLAPAYLAALLRLTRRGLGRWLGASGKIAAGDLAGSTSRFSVALMTVAISGSLIISLLILITSFRNSLTDWINSNISADVYVKPAACKSNFCFFPLSERLIETIRALPEVEGVDRFRTLNIDFGGNKIVAGFGDTGLARRFYHERNPAARDTGRYAESADEQEAGISIWLSTKTGLKKGDAFDLPTPQGLKRFRVRDVFSSYSTSSGFMYLDRRWLKEYWGLDDATQVAVYLKPGSDIPAFIRGLRERVGGEYSLDIMDAAELRGRVIETFNRTFAITYAIELISVVVSLIGVVTMLLALVLERRRELSILRYLGGEWGMIERSFVISAGFAGLSGAALGCVIGPLMSVIFIEVINKVSFGWEIRYELPAVPLLLTCAGLFLTTIIAGFIPSRVARRIDPKRYISFE